MITLLSAEKEQTHMCLAQSGIKLPNCLRKNPAKQDSPPADALAASTLPPQCEPARRAFYAIRNYRGFPIA